MRDTRLLGIGISEAFNHFYTDLQRKLSLPTLGTLEACVRPFSKIPVDVAERISGHIKSRESEDAVK